ncbi:hypothetical protein F2Y51_14230 [Phocaeicola dorei]|uniref:Uncharacterized protein n=1 Tax=Phocaeicola dorei TaxID=357276 RepID=A0A4Q5HSB0_9BACT|nr:hypothetical protein F2Y56_14130 [Phocaeicola dorei]KAA5396852.1 hypothetical protein F2Y58_15165 [Phocaeicola dorei]KAA5404213.1 hypothetical protein F2Y51_14230 [Phocaeicola dorei]RYT93978.1 hypothetical protein EAJ02_14625 [Phocaeicola dorei]
MLRLAKASEKYPVNLDEVWTLVYSRKSDAVDALQRDFVENDDYQVLRQNPQNPQGGRPVNEYRLTVPCLEYFIVKKVRSVFEVYRKVFHKAPEMAKQLKQATVKDKIVVADWLTGFLNLNESSKLALAKTIAEPLGLPTPDYTPSKGVLKSAGELLKENECTISAQAFNQKMIEKGYMVELTRPSSKGGVKKFKSIIGDGLNYGENQVNPNNPKSTQPLYYEDKFIELLISLQLKQIA